MKTLLRIYGTATILLAAATILSYARHQPAPVDSATLNMAPVLVDCCADPMPCGGPGEPACWPPIPPPRTSN